MKCFDDERERDVIICCSIVGEAHVISNLHLTFLLPLIGRLEMGSCDWASIVSMWPGGRTAAFRLVISFTWEDASEMAMIYDLSHTVSWADCIFTRSLEHITDLPNFPDTIDQCGAMSFVQRTTVSYTAEAVWDAGVRIRRLPFVDTQTDGSVHVYRYDEGKVVCACPACDPSLTSSNFNPSEN